MSLSNAERQEFETVVRVAMEPALAQLKTELIQYIDAAYEAWALLLADIQRNQAAIVMKSRADDRDLFFQRQAQVLKAREQNRTKVKGFAG